MTKLSQYTLLISAASCVFISLGLNHSQGLFLLPMSEKLNTGRELFSLAGGLGVLFSGLFAPIFGGLADKYGAGKSLSILCFLQIISWIWLGNIANSTDLLGARILLGIGSSAILGIALSVTGRSVSTQNKSLFLGLIMASGSLGQFIVVPIINIIIQNYDWQAATFISAFIVSLIFLFSFLIAKNSSKQHSTSPESQDIKIEEMQNQSLTESLREASKNKSYILLTTGFFVCGFHVTFVGTHLPAFLNDNNLQPWVGASALSFIGLFNIVGTLSFGYLGSKLSKKNLLSSLYSMRSLLFLVFIISPKNELTVLIFASILGILWLSTVPLTNGIISDIFGQGYVTTLFGIAILSHNIGSFLGSWIGGRIYDLYGSYDPVWWICVLLGFASAAINYPINIRPVNRLQQTKS